MRAEAPPSDNIYVTELPPGLDDATLREIFSSYGTISQCRVLLNGTGQGKCAGLVRFATLEEATWIIENLDGNIPQGLTEPIGCRYADTPEMKAQRQAARNGTAGTWRAAPYVAQPGRVGGGWEAPSFKGSGKSWDAGGKGGKGVWEGGGKSGGWQSGALVGGGGWSLPKGAGKATLPGAGRKGSKANENCTIKVLHDGLLESKCLPGGAGYTNDENALYIANLPVDTADVDLYRIFAPFGPIAPKGVKAMLYQDGSCKGIGFVNFLEQSAAESAVMTLNGTLMPDGTTLIVRVKTPGKGDVKGDAAKGRGKVGKGYSDEGVVTSEASFDDAEEAIAG